MPYVDLAGLSRYASRQKDRLERDYALLRDMQWTRSEKAGAVSLWPVGGTPLKPVVDFLFTDTPPASGDKGPDNPSTISGVSSIGLTVCQEAGVDEHSYTLSLGDTYYGGSIDLATGLMTVTFASIVIDGTTTYSSSSGVTEGTNFYRLGLYPSPARKNSVIESYSACDTLPINNGDNFIRLANNSYKIEAQFQKSLLNLGDGESYSVVQSAFQTFFSAHPTAVVYPVSTPYTVQLTPTQILSLTQTDKYTPRLNTVYTDAQAVQVGYVKSPIRDEYELQQAVIAQGGNV